MHSTNNKTLWRVLLDARAITARTFLLCVASSVEVKTGDAFGLDIGTSIKDLQVEVTLPWSPAVVCAVIACGAATAVGKAVARAREEQFPADPPDIARAVPSEIAEAAKRYTGLAQPVDSAG